MMEKVRGKGDTGMKRSVCFNLPNLHAQQAGDGADGADGAASEGSRRLAASINQCHALEPHL